MITNTGEILERLNVAKTLYSKFDKDDRTQISEALIEDALREVHHRGDLAMIGFVWMHFLLGGVFTFFYGTSWSIFLGVGLSLVVIFHLSVYFKPCSFFTRALAGVVLQAFVLLFIYLTKGQAEVRLFFFTSFTILIVYQDWRAIWPSVLLFFGQMIALTYLSSYLDYIHLQGYRDFILNLMPTTENGEAIDFQGLGFYIGISFLQVTLAGLWAKFLHFQTISEVHSREEILTKQIEVEKSNAQLAQNVKTKTQDLQEALEATQANEEELRQNMEELQATQDEMEVQRKRLVENQERMEKVEIELRERQAKMERSQWLEGNITQFDDIMRLKYDTSIEEFSDVMIQHLAELIKATQGAFYIFDEDQNSLQMTAGYACTPQSVKQSEFKVGEGILGQIIKTKKTVYLQDLPEEGIVIESALTRVHSRSLLIVPLLYNEALQGVLEIAVIENIDDLHQELIKRLSKNLAAMLQSMRGILKTQKLLSQSQQMTAQLQENARELEKTKKEVEQRATEFQTQFHAIDRSMLVLEYDEQGKIKSANENFALLSGYDASELKNRHQNIFLEETYTNSPAYQKLWEDIAQKGYAEAEYACKTKEGTRFWMRANHYSLEEGNEQRIRVLAYDITTEMEQAQKIKDQLAILADKEEMMRRNLDIMKELQKDVQEKAAALQAQLNAINLSTAMVEYDANGFIKYVNDKFKQLTQYTSEELIGQEHKALVGTKVANSKSYKILWERLHQNEFIDGEFQFTSKSGETIWLRGSYYPVADKNGKVTKILQLATDISNEIRQEEQIKEYLINLEKTQSNLKQASQELEAQLQAIDRSTGMIELNPEGKILRVNDKFLAWVKYDADDLVGKHHQVLIDSKNSQTTEYQNFWKKLHKNQMMEGQFIKQAQDQSPLYLHESYYPVLDNRKSLSKIIGIISLLPHSVNGKNKSLILKS